jgi:hypothetical protein
VEPVSRRRFLGGATAVAAVSTIGGGLPAAAQAAELTRADADLREPLVVRVRDLRSGAIDVYLGEREISVKDPQLAARLSDLAR